MLKPTKHTNLKMNVLSLSAQILKILKKSRIIEYNKLINKLCSNLDETKTIELKELLSSALNLLFLLNLLTYHLQSDSFEYLEKHEN